MATKRKSPKKVSNWTYLINSSWTKVLSVILTLGSIAGVFWAADQHWVNFPFHNQTADLTLQKSTNYAKQLSDSQTLQMQQFSNIIKDMQRDQKIQTAQNQAIFLMKQEMSMREAMAKLSALNKPISQTFKDKLAEVVKEREAAESEVKRLLQTN